MKACNSRMKRIVEKFARTKAILLAVSIFVIVAALVNTRLKPDFSYLTQTFHYSWEYAYQLLEQIGSGGRAAHLLVLPADLLMAFCYTAFLIGLNYRVFRRLPLNRTTFRLVTLSPLLLTTAQITEIVSLFILIINYPMPMYGLANWCNLVTIIKTVLTPICFLTPAAGWGRSLMLRRRMNSEQNRSD